MYNSTRGYEKRPISNSIGAKTLDNPDAKSALLDIPVLHSALWMGCYWTEPVEVIGLVRQHSSDNPSFMTDVCACRVTDSCSRGPSVIGQQYVVGRDAASTYVILGAGSLVPRLPLSS